MPSLCSFRGCNTPGTINSRLGHGKFCAKHYAEVVMPLIQERQQNAGWGPVRVDSLGRIMDDAAASRQDDIERDLREPYLDTALSYHRLIVDQLT